MIRQLLKLMIALVWLSRSVATASPSTGVGQAWDISPADRADYYPSSFITWPTRSEASALEIRSISATGAPVKRHRQRRDLDNESKLERLPGSKREARLMSPETWSKSPTIQFHKRSNPEHITPESYDDPDNNEEPANLPPLIRAHYTPKTDFVTSGARPARGPVDDIGRPRQPFPLQPMIHPVEVARESRELALARPYPYEEPYETPMYRTNIVREHDFDVRIPPQNSYGYYPDRYRTQRDYYYRGGTERNTAIPYNMYDRYREEDPNYEQYDNANRYRPTPKPKRIIYYATLPEIVRKPVDLRNYQRPYDPMMRNPESQMPETERPRMVTPNNIPPEANRRPMRYPYDAYDNFVKRSSPYDRRRLPPQPYPGGEEDRSREQDRNRGSYKDKMRSDDRPLESQISRSDDRRLPWPVQIGTEVSIKENERIPGRKIFGQLENYERYDGSRSKKTSKNAELKENSNEENNNSNNDSNNN